MTPPEIKLRKGLRRFKAGVFTDADVTRCTGLSARSVRHLIKVGAVRTLSTDRGAGRIRTFDATTFKRLAVVAAIHDTGFSLQLAGQLAYLLPSDDLLYRTHDPINALSDTAGLEHDRDHPPRSERAKWFDPDVPAAVNPENDWLVEIYDSRFVALVAQNKRLRSIYGDLRRGGTQFVSWSPAHAQLVEYFSTNTEVAAKWEGRRQSADQIDPRFLNYKFEDHVDDPLASAGHAAKWRPISTMTINVSLAIRLALRRYLDIEPGADSSLVGANEAERDRVASTAKSEKRNGSI
jgi:DNA-binding transcriptional MerR regulator